MKTKRKATIAVAAIAVGALMLVGLTMAYLTDSRRVDNYLGIGTGTGGKNAVQISLEEPSFAAKADEVEYMLANPNAEIESATALGLLPGDKIYKDPLISNSGSESVYLRARIDVSDEMFELLEDLGLQINPAFIDGGDGYWYYAGESTGVKTALEFKAGQTLSFFVCVKEIDTDELSFYSMEIPEAWTNVDVMNFLNLYRAYEGDDEATLIDIPVIAEAVQYSGLEVSVPWNMDDEIGHDIYAVASEERTR